MKPAILFVSALACVLAPCLHAGPKAVQGVDKTAAEVRYTGAAITIPAPRR